MVYKPHTSVKMIEYQKAFKFAAIWHAVNGYITYLKSCFLTTALNKNSRTLHISQVLQQAWPFIGQYLEKLLVETIAPAIRGSSNHLQTFNFTKIDMGDKVQLLCRVTQPLMSCHTASTQHFTRTPLFSEAFCLPSQSLCVCVCHSPWRLLGWRLTQKMTKVKFFWTFTSGDYKLKPVFFISCQNHSWW